MVDILDTLNSILSTQIISDLELNGVSLLWIVRRLNRKKPFYEVADCTSSFTSFLLTPGVEFGDPLFIAGQEVHLVGVSTNRRGYMLIAKGDNTIEVPHRFTKFEKVCCSSTSNSTLEV